MNGPKIFRPSTLLIAVLLLGGGALAFLAAQNAKHSSSARAYSIGEKAAREIVSPKKMAVVDPVATEARREAEAAKVPVVFRCDRTISDRAVADFSNQFVFTREKFLDAVEHAFKTRRLNSNQVDTAKFRKLFNHFQSKNPSFPVGPKEAAYWAQHDLDKIRVKKLGEELRRAASRFIRPEHFPENNLTSQVRILPVAEPPATLALAKAQSRLVRRTNLVSLAKARKETATRFENENRAVQKFMANHLAANCTYDTALTDRFRAEKTNALWAVASFEAGQVIVRAGEVIDARAKAALDELKVQKPAAPGDDASRARLWYGALACFCAALLVGIVGFFRRRPKAPYAGNVVVLPGAENDALREKLMPHLARGLMNKFVRALISQRSDLMHTQEAGTEQLAKLEERLDQIHTRLENRQAFYESRIARLEKELAAAEEQNRDLIRAKIHEARQNLEWAKQANNAG